MSTNSNNLPVVLIIGKMDEDWYKLCEDCKDKFRIEQATLDVDLALDLIFEMFFMDLYIAIYQ